VQIILKLAQCTCMSMHYVFYV